MPAKRLPWYKVWAEHTDHPKVCELSDGEYRTWHYLLAKASQQPERWTFASIRHAAAVTGRPEKHIKALVERGLLDLAADSLIVHNAPKWQDVYPSDYSGKTPPILREPCPEHSERLPLDIEERGERGDTESPRPIRPRESVAHSRELDVEKAREYAEGKGYSGEKVDRMLEKFLAHHESVGWKRAAGVVIRDRQKAWVRWVQNELDYHPPAKQDYRPMKVVY